MSERTHRPFFYFRHTMSKPKLTDDDFCRAAKTLGCEVAVIKAVAEVESRGNGFYTDGFPVILFERHKFRSFTGGRYNTSHPQISGPAGNYGSAGQNQRNKFNLAFKLDPIAAMKSCSWGKFQLMGFNHALCGFATVGEFVDAMKHSEGKQLDAFVNFVINTGLSDELRRLDWKGFAKGYNGAGYAQNKYDTKMAAAFKKYTKEAIDCTDSAADPAVSAPGADPGTVNTDTISANRPATTDQPPITKEVKAEITPDGGVSVETSEPVSADKERIAVVKGEKKTWGAVVTAKLTGVVSGNVFFQWIWAQIDKISGLPIPTLVWAIVSVTIGLVTLLWMVWQILDIIKSNKYSESIDNLLVKENSTPGNLVQLIPADEAELYRLRGFKIITRGAKTP